MYAHAQAATIDLSLSTIPLNPEPLQQVTISAESYSTDLSQANMLWTYNGKTISNSIGQTSITVTAPASGLTGTISLTASGGAFSSTTATLLLRPASVDLLWEGADSYTPPFYKGLALPSTGGIIRVTAIPSINAPANLSYAWTQNDDAQQADSGYNKSSFTFQNSDLIPTEDVSVTESSGDFSGTGDIQITPGDPSIVGYFNTNGFIDYANGSSDQLSTTGTGATIHFEPYFFSVPTNIPHDLSFSFLDNSNNPIPAGNEENEVPLSRPDGGGQSLFNVSVTTNVYSLQNLERPFTLNFN